MNQKKNNRKLLPSEGMECSDTGKSSAASPFMKKGRGQTKSIPQKVKKLAGGTSQKKKTSQTLLSEGRK